MWTPLALLLTAALVAPSPAQDAEAPTGLEALRVRHAAALLALSAAAVDDGLFDEGERLALEAADASPGLDVAARVRDIAGRRRDTVSDEAARAARQTYLGSSECLADRERLARDQEERERKLAAELIDLVEALEEEPARSDERDAAARWALDLDPDGRPLARALGRERHAELVAERDAARSLARLAAGEVVRGAPFDPAQLKGKVVVWRSFSL